jgi:hypothetical protein
MNQITLEEIILDFKNKVDDSNNKYPTKLFGPNLEQVLNAAGFYKKKKWVGLTKEDADSIECWFREEIENDRFSVENLIARIEAKLKDKNI